ncbi:MAG: hypothetical protein WDW36_000552 [Sanguina aurantia]
MLLDLAAWVLRRFIAASTAPRLATLAYWACVMAAAVPIMMLLSRHNRRWWARMQAAPANAAPVQSAGPLPLPQHADTGSRGAAGVAQAQTKQGAAPSRCRVQRPAHRMQPRLVTAWVPGPGMIRAAVWPRHSPPHASRERSTRMRRRRASATSPARITSTAASTVAMTPSHLPARAPPSAARTVLLPSRFHVPHTIMRKGYHLLALALFLPAFAWDVRMLQASLAIAFAVLVAAEALRCASLPHVSPALQRFMSDFADARDVGPLYITHFTLLLGMALPVWLCDRVCGAPSSAARTSSPSGDWASFLSSSSGSLPSSSSSSSSLQHLVQWVGLGSSESGGGSSRAGGCGGGSDGCVGSSCDAALQQQLVCSGLVGLCGLVALGVGDTAASCVGFLLGRRRLFRGSSKTAEGTGASAVAMMLSWAWAVRWLGLGNAMDARLWVALAVVTGGAALLEAVTQQLDNLVVPLYYAAHVASLFS